MPFGRLVFVPPNAKQPNRCRLVVWFLFRLIIKCKTRSVCLFRLIPNNLIGAIWSFGFCFAPNSKRPNGCHLVIVVLLGGHKTKRQTSGNMIHVFDLNCSHKNKRQKQKTKWQQYLSCSNICLWLDISGCDFRMVLDFPDGRSRWSIYNTSRKFITGTCCMGTLCEINKWYKINK